jgi:hypothetical protein
MEHLFTSPVFTTPLDNGCITSQTFTPPMHSEFRQEQEQQQEEYIRPETYLQIYNKATKEFEKKSKGNSIKCAATYNVGLLQLSFAEYFNDV